MDFLLDTIIEMIFEVFLEGSIEATMSSKVPKFVRFILLSFLIMIFSGLLYVAIAIAIEHNSLDMLGTDTGYCHNSIHKEIP